MFSSQLFTAIIIEYRLETILQDKLVKKKKKKKERKKERKKEKIILPCSLTLNHIFFLKFTSVDPDGRKYIPVLFRHMIWRHI